MILTPFFVSLFGLVPIRVELVAELLHEVSVLWLHGQVVVILVRTERDDATVCRVVVELAANEAVPARRYIDGEWAIIHGFHRIAGKTDPFSVTIVRGPHRVTHDRLFVRLAVVRILRKNAGFKVELRGLAEQRQP